MWSSSKSKKSATTRKKERLKKIQTKIDKLERKLKVDKDYDAAQKKLETLRRRVK